MSRTAAQIEIFPRAKLLIEKELKRRDLESHYYNRMRIIIMSQANQENNQIAEALGCGEHTVGRWRQRWKERHQKLKEYEKGPDGRPVTDKELVEKIKEILTDWARIGAPSRITEIEVNRLVALACESPEKYGLPFTHWTHQELSKQAHKMKIKVSPAHVGRLLKKRLITTQE